MHPARIFLIVQSSNGGGETLWTSDGTPTGTRPFAEPRYLGQRAFVPFGRRLIFLDRNTLWVSDGTPSGTRLLRNEAVSPRPGDDTTFFFTAPGEAGVTQLWASDGTEAGTRKLYDYQSSAVPQSGFVRSGDLFFFSAGGHLWKTNGTAAGTVQVDNAPHAPDVHGIVAVGGRVLFSATNPTGLGDGLWVSDGTTPGTRSVEGLPDTNPLTGDTILSGLIAVGNRAFTIAVTGQYDAMRQNLWIIDAQGAAQSVGGDWRARTDLLAGCGGALLFAAVDDRHGRELWRSDGTANGTGLLRDINIARGGVNPQRVAAIGDTLFYTTFDTSGSELWASDGTARGTRQLHAFGNWYNSEPDYLMVFNNTLFFTAADSGDDTELWRSDGTIAGTQRVKDISPGATGSLPLGLTVFNGALFFSAHDGAHGRELWRSDGTEAGTTLVADIQPDADAVSMYWLVVYNGALYFTANDGVHGAEVWRSDGTKNGTQIAADIVSGATGSNAEPFAVAGGRLIVEANDATGHRLLWASDGTTGGTQPLKDPYPDLAGVDVHAQSATVVGGKLFFFVFARSANELVRLWVSDGTKDGTHSLNAVSWYDLRLVPLGNRVLFWGTSAETGAEPWVSDGTEAGTHLVADISPGPTGSVPSYPLYIVSPLAPLPDGQRVVFGANDRVLGGELWQSDGTAEGTALVQEIAPGPVGSLPQVLGRAGDRMLFMADDQQHGNELWAASASGIPATVAQLTGPDAAATGERQDFTIQLRSGPAPSAAASFTYRWEATEHAPRERSAGLSDTLRVGWATPGTKTITVTVSTSEGPLLVETWRVAVRGAALPTVSSGQNISVRESGGAATITLTLDRAPTHAVSATYHTVDSSAEAGKEYTASAGTVTFVPGETQQAISVPIIDDGTPESTKQFTLLLDDATGALVGDHDQVAVRIEDDDHPLAGRVLLPLVIK